MKRMTKILVSFVLVFICVFSCLSPIASASASTKAYTCNYNFGDVANKTFNFQSSSSLNNVWIKFKATQNCCIKLSLATTMYGHLMADSDGYILLHDSNKSMISSVSCLEPGTSVQYALRAGETYYVRLSAIEGFARLNMTITNVFGTTHNSSISRALNIGNTTSAMDLYDTSTTRKYYKFALNSKGRVSIQLVNSFIAGGDYRITIRNSKTNRLVATKTIYYLKSPNCTLFSNLNLEAGTYYVEVVPFDYYSPINACLRFRAMY